MRWFNNKEAAIAGKGTMVAIALENPEQVDAFYHKAIELVGSCGAKGADAVFCAGYFRDIDGNKLNAFAW